MIDMLKKIGGNGIAYGIYYFLICHLIGFAGGMEAKSVLKVSVPISLFGMIANGLMYSRFTKRNKILEQINFDTEDTANTKLEAIANHLIDDDLVSGKLCLTENELIFRSHKQEEYRWNLSSFDSFNFYPAFFNKGGEFVIKTKEGRKLMFEVDLIKSWKKALYNEV